VLGVHVPVAADPLARLLGLALLPRELAGPGLLIPRCRSVHTFGMRFELDLFFLGADGRPLAVFESVAANRTVSLRTASAVLELPARVDGPPADERGAGVSSGGESVDRTT
jgi:uncharacterized membrane protein (UPF0127 family)